MSHVDHRFPVVGQACQGLEDLVSRARVQVASGLVGYDDGRVVGQRARNSHPLLFSTREGVRQAMGVFLNVGYFKASQRPLAPCSPLEPASASEFQGELDIF
jgi:hypothetical protein